MFADMRGHWAENDVEEAAELGLVAGNGDGTFSPDDAMTRAQGTVVSLRVYKKLAAKMMELQERIAKLEGGLRNA